MQPEFISIGVSYRGHGTLFPIVGSAETSGVTDRRAQIDISIILH